MTFWQKLEKPFFALAPMADVSWTEFVSADGLILADAKGKQKLMADLLYAEEERPIVAQLFSASPEQMEKAARLCRELGFDGIDINMGCPDRSIEKQGCGAAMMRHPKEAQEIIAAAKRGSGLPISVKTRIGYHKDELDLWLSALLSVEPAAITLHARTRKELSKVSAKWDRIKDAVAIRNAYKSETLIIGNGDAVDLADAHKKAEESGADGVMLGRAIFGNPWLFHPEKDATTVSIEEKLCALVEHTKLFGELLSHKSFAIMKKHYKAYAQGFEGAHALRARLMEAHDVADIETLVEEFVHRAPPALLASSATLTA